MTTLSPALPSPTTTARPVTAELPRWSSVLVVVAHPDDESLGLGAVIDAFARRGAEVTVLSLTPGARYTDSPVAGDLLPLRRAQLAAAGTILGVSRVELRDYPNGHLEEVAHHLLVEDVAGEIGTWAPDGLLVLDPGGVNGRADHVVATGVAVEAATHAGISVLAWGLPPDVAATLNEETGSTVFTPVGPGSFTVPVDRERQRLATLTYAHDAAADTLGWRRLELLGDTERLRWLRRGPADQTQMLVTHQAGDRFAIGIRGHTVVVDQPEAIGGDDVGPTPTELFVASLAACVGFYARRYLARHRLDFSGLRVEVAWDMATKPSRVGEVTLRVVVPAGVPEERRAGLLAQAGHCTVHNTLHQPPPITIDLT
ncbi:MAG: PIG-L family deacetylase [Actinomycetes bacterium]